MARRRKRRGSRKPKLSLVDAGLTINALYQYGFLDITQLTTDVWVYAGNIGAKMQSPAVHVAALGPLAASKLIKRYAMPRGISAGRIKIW